MKSILIKDTTKEERAKIVAESLGDDYELGWRLRVCGNKL